MAKSVLKDWVHDLTIQMQGTLLCAMRGPDGMPKDDSAKALVRAFRAVLTNNALPLGPKNTFAGDGTGVTSQEDVENFFKSIDQYPHHWYNHFFHAAEIIGYYHSDKNIQEFWLNFYYQCCDDAHLNPETKDQLAERLSGDGDPNI
tara:strand:- start:5134 stop:5571 length:438 start_codon:yes stop_codon:yes gene_type:complete